MPLKRCMTKQKNRLTKKTKRLIARAIRLTLRDCQQKMPLEV